MAEKENRKKGDCVIKYEAHLTEEGDLGANLKIEGMGLDILIGIRSIIGEICRDNNISLPFFLGMIERCNAEGTSVDVGAIERAMEGKK